MGRGSAARPGAAPGRRPRSVPAPARAAALIARHRFALSAWLVPGLSGATARFGSPWRLRMLGQGFSNPASVSTCWPAGDSTYVTNAWTMDLFLVMLMVTNQYCFEEFFMSQSDTPWTFLPD